MSYNKYFLIISSLILYSCGIDETSIRSVNSLQAFSRIPLAAGGNHACAIISNGAVKCWGLNDEGQLGQGSTDTLGDDANELGSNLAKVDLGIGASSSVGGDTGIGVSFGATQLALGSSHSCALLEGGKIKCWGFNDQGQLGLGDSDSRGDNSGEMGNDLEFVDLGNGRTATGLAAGNKHNCALLDNGSVKCWGDNISGQLGNGNNDDIGDGANEMGSNLSAVDLGSGNTAIQVVAGGLHSCALLANGSVKCWGENSNGQLGLNNETDLNAPSSTAIDLGSGRTAKFLSAGNTWTCAILDNDQLKCWGGNTDGRLGLGDTDDRGDCNIVSCALTNEEMGDNLDQVELGGSPILVSAGSTHSCILNQSSAVKCWGTSSAGSLGQTGTNNLGDAAGEMGSSLPTVSLGAGGVEFVAVGNGFSCALFSSDAVRCWGENGSGQLGRGDTADQGDDAGEMGSNLQDVPL